MVVGVCKGFGRQVKLQSVLCCFATASQFSRFMFGLLRRPWRSMAKRLQKALLFY